MDHKTTIDYPGGLEALANNLGNLRYDVLADFLSVLSEKLEVDSFADEGRGRKKLSKALGAASLCVENAWRQCKPHIPDVNKPTPPNSVESGKE